MQAPEFPSGKVFAVGRSSRGRKNCEKYCMLKKIYHPELTGRSTEQTHLLGAN